MISCEGFAKKHVAVVGLGKSGLSAARALCKSGARVLAWDDKESSRKLTEDEGIPVRAPSRMNWAVMDALVLSPGIPHTFPVPHEAAVLAKHAGVPIVGDVELLATSGSQAPQYAITGTNGKSTTTALVGHIHIRAGRDVEVGGNLGPAICDMAMLEDQAAYILELSSYQLELCPSARFKIAVLLNITPDHIDRHGDMNGYIEAKKNIFRGQGVGDTAIIGIDDQYCRKIYDQLVRNNGRTIIPISAHQVASGGVYVQNGKLIDDLDGQAWAVMDLGSLIHLPGDHNAQNVAAAYALARMAGINTDAIVAGVESFPGLEHRQERLGIIDGVAIVNDSKATNAEAAQKALSCYENIYWIAGGRAKDGGLNDITDKLQDVRRAYVFGEAATDFAKTLSNVVAVETYDDLEAATCAALNAARIDGLSGATVLLSPACASFDQFTSFEHRGNVFKDIIKNVRSSNASGGMNAHGLTRGAA